MPTPVSTARQCLTPESAHALDEAVSVARRRGHAQTTSLHAVSALLSLPSSPLREACARARNSAYSPRLQFKALDLSLSVSLDRVPSTQLADDPPVSNSLMAAIKRSQANQRRQPENFYLYQQIQQQQSSTSCVKVELQHLILSILDDPIVSRVFSESGFRSSDIKLAILRPLPQLFKYSRTRIPPIFLCNLAENPDPTRRSFSFPFSGFSGVVNGDENCRRIGDALVRNKGRNPLLVGVCAYDALRSFTDSLERRKYDILPVELSGLNVISIEKEVSRFVKENSDDGLMNSRFEEVGKMVEHSLGPGLVVNFGDLKTLVGGDASGEAVNYVVAKLTRLLEIHGGKLWLIGAAASYEMYLKFLSKFPSVEKDWDSQLLPITTLRSPWAESYSSSRPSLMESFVPFGGFFSTPSDLKSPLSGSYQSVSRCNVCNEKCELEVTSLSKGVSTASVADQYQSSLPSWLQMAELGNKGLDAEKAKDDGLLLSAKVTGLQKKWDNICHQLHHSQLVPEAKSYQVGSQVQTIVGFQFIKDRKETGNNCSSSNTYASPNGNVEIISTSKQSLQFPMVSKSKNESLISKLFEKPSETEDLVPGGLRSSCCSFSNSSGGDGRTSSNSATSVTTDLGLGIFSSPTCKELKKHHQIHPELLQDDSSCLLVNGSNSNRPAQSSSCSCPDFCGKFDPRNAKMLFKALVERIGWQEEAVSVVSQTIAHCRTRNEKFHGASPRGDIWLNFLGPERFGKKKVAIALAEILYESKENFINVDLSSKDGVIHTNALYHRHETLEYGRNFRGKTVVDYIAEELSKKQLSIVYLENIENADLLAQNSLSRAIRTGKFSDSHGREVSINNAIFVTTSNVTRGNRSPSYQKDSAKYSEEMIVRARGRPIQISLRCAVRDNIDLNESLITRQSIPNPIIVNKRKLTGRNENLEHLETPEIAKRAHKASNLNLDLNFPAEDNEVHETNNGNSDNDPGSENSKAWLEDFFNQVDETVVFKPFDFDALAEKIMKLIGESFHKIVSSECLLEIDSKVMNQILAADCLSDMNGVVGDWVELVLSKGFVEAKKRYSLTAHSVVKLVACEDPFSEGHAPYLPPTIILN